jgi:hypothetical protein
VCVPETLITAMALLPCGVARATIGSSNEKSFITLFFSLVLLQFKYNCFLL